MAAIRLSVSALVLSVLLAAPARADADDEQYFLKDVQKSMPTVLARYGPDALIAEGYRVCLYNQHEHIDHDYSGEIDRIIMEMPMSEHEAIHLTVIAPVDLDCGG